MYKPNIVLRGHSEEISCVTFLKNIKQDDLFNEYFLASGSSNGNLFIWSLLDLSPVFKIRAYQNIILAIIEILDSRSKSIVITQAIGGEYKIWNFFNGVLTLNDSFTIPFMGFCQIVPVIFNNEMAIISSREENVMLYSISSKSVKSWNCNNTLLKSLGTLMCLNPFKMADQRDDKYLLAGFESGIIVLYALPKGGLLAHTDLTTVAKSLNPPNSEIETGPIFAIAFDPLSGLGFASSAITSLPLYSFKLTKAEERLDESWTFHTLNLIIDQSEILISPFSELILISASGDEKSSSILVASGTTSNSLAVFEANVAEGVSVTLELTHELKYHTKRISCLDLFPSALLPRGLESSIVIAAGSRDYLISIWGLPTKSATDGNRHQRNLSAPKLEDFLSGRCLTL